MSLSSQRIEQLAAILKDAEVYRRAVRKLTDVEPALDWNDAYDVQWAIRRRKEARGTRVAGLKMASRRV